VQLEKVFIIRRPDEGFAHFRHISLAEQFAHFGIQPPADGANINVPRNFLVLVMGERSGPAQGAVGR